jgi:hypothetical protein
MSASQKVKTDDVECGEETEPCERQKVTGIPHGDIPARRVRHPLYPRILTQNPFAEVRSELKAG